LNPNLSKSRKVITCIGEANECEFWLDMMQELKVLPQREHIDYMGRLVKIRSMLFNLKKIMAAPYTGFIILMRKYIDSRRVQRQDREYLR
jgi:hypothetical protein